MEPDLDEPDLDILDELMQAAKSFASAEFHDDMPIKEAPELLRRAARLIRDLRDRCGDY